jgi:hypothetical protein
LVGNSRDARMYSLEGLFATSAWWVIWLLIAHDDDWTRRRRAVAGIALVLLRSGRYRSDPQRRATARVRPRSPYLATPPRVGPGRRMRRDRSPEYHSLAAQSDRRGHKRPPLLDPSTGCRCAGQHVPRLVRWPDGRRVGIGRAFRRRRAIRAGLDAPRRSHRTTGRR